MRIPTRDIFFSRLVQLVNPTCSHAAAGLTRQHHVRGNWRIYAQSGCNKHPVSNDLHGNNHFILRNISSGILNKRKCNSPVLSPARGYIILPLIDSRSQWNWSWLSIRSHLKVASASSLPSLAFRWDTGEIIQIIFFWFVLRIQKPHCARGYSILLYLCFLRGCGFSRAVRGMWCSVGQLHNSPCSLNAVWLLILLAKAASRSCRSSYTASKCVVMVSPECVRECEVLAWWRSSLFM